MKKLGWIMWFFASTLFALSITTPPSDACEKYHTVFDCTFAPNNLLFFGFASVNLFFFYLVFKKDIKKFFSDKQD